ncbi:hypothetical protein D3C77_498940 [compost metagenome]
MRPDLVAGRPVISTRDDAVLAAYVSRLAGTRHVECFQHLGSGLPQIKLNVGRITGLQRPIRARDEFIANVGRNDELIHADLVVRHFQPGAVIVEDDQGYVIAPLPFAVPGIPHLFAELLHLDVGEPCRELLGVELE